MPSIEDSTGAAPAMPSIEDSTGAAPEDGYLSRANSPCNNETSAARC